MKRWPYPELLNAWPHRMGCWLGLRHSPSMAFSRSNLGELMLETFTAAQEGRQPRDVVLVSGCRHCRVRSRVRAALRRLTLKHPTKV